MESGIRVRRLGAFHEREIVELTEVLIDCVEGGASVSFMEPLSREKARAYWRSVAEHRALDAAGTIVGTVQLMLNLPENQPHRADLAKMLVHRRARHQGVGRALLAAAEECAHHEGRNLLVLDTASADAERLYERHGWQRVGVVPRFALYPDGRLCATTFYFKALEDGLSAPAAP